MPKLKLNVGKYDNNSFSTNLRVILREKGITVEKLGDDIGLSSSILYDYLNGKTKNQSRKEKLKYSKSNLG